MKKINTEVVIVHHVKKLLNKAFLSEFLVFLKQPIWV